MKIILVSDSHTNTQGLTLIRERHLQDGDLFIHCGDSQLPSHHPVMLGYLSVRGNCDFDSNYPLERLETLPTKDKVFMTHGHEYDVKYSIQRLYYKALEVGANIVCFGHSHCILAQMEEGILFINPGSIMIPRNTKERTYATITILEDSFIVNYLEVLTGEVLFHQTFKR